MLATSIALLSTQDCVHHSKTVWAAREHWRAQHPSNTFFTLGASPYDVDRSMRDYALYYERAAVYNLYLADRFAQLYKALATALHTLTDLAIAFPTTLAYPGFHIWLADGIPTDDNPAHKHVDRHYLGYQWPVKEPLELEQISFTLCLRKPSLGAGLTVWDITADDLARAYESGAITDAAQLDEAAKAVRCDRYLYEDGTLTVHSGKYLHQVTPVSHTLPDDERITLQGHGVKVGQQLELFW